jgi:hypothetical protein
VRYLLAPQNFSGSVMWSSPFGLPSGPVPSCTSDASWRDTIVNFLSGLGSMIVEVVSLSIDVKSDASSVRAGTSALWPKKRNLEPSSTTIPFFLRSSLVPIT